jgi:hypothetical protein
MRYDSRIDKKYFGIKKVKVYRGNKQRIDKGHGNEYFCMEIR